MTQEEKAKAYDKVREKIAVRFGTDVAEGIFSEFEESEDERIRKELISLVENWKIFNPNSPFDEHPVYTSDKDTVDKILAWLEKQGEQKSQRMISAEAKEAMYDKPADKVEPKCEESKTKIFDAPTPFEDKLYAFVAACEFLAIPSKIEFILEHSQEILDAAREQIGKEQSSAWSEEDEVVVEDIEEAVINYWHGQSQEDLLDWLKSLKTKVQPKQEWSEKDEEELEIAIDTLKESGRYDSAKWVQSLKRRIGGKL